MEVKLSQCSILLFLNLFSLFFKALSEEFESQEHFDKYGIDGTVIPPDVVTPDWLLSTKVLVNGGERLGFLRYVLITMDFVV